MIGAYHAKCAKALLAAAITGRRAVESGQLAQARTREGSIKGGLKAGGQHAESGHMSKIGKMHGPIQGKKNVESGLLEKIRPAAGRKGGPIGMHNRWHVRRGIVSATCKICTEAEKCIL